jgi:propionyl-CoA carboxylase alpha chain
MITRLLVANRGEIARRIFRTCRDAGIGTVAVFSEADATAPHTIEADLAVALPGNAPAETYLRADLLVAAAVDAGADAVHPGYGFLAENAAFARAVIKAGLVWVGPPPEAVEAMGSKTAAKKLAAGAGVPVLPELDPAELIADHLPVLVKAAGGGGGRGIRIVRALPDLPAALAAARSEAESAFGDPSVFCEPYLPGARHVEVQVMADRHGTVWTLGERECSLQRRYQKVIEEAPSPAVDPALRADLCRAAAAITVAVGYQGAGTVEFLLDGDGRFSFLEMNTRLQVEHPVTECVTGVDLVDLQLRVAAGQALGEPPAFPAGHAIEARLYAEDPAAGWRPTSGRLQAFEVPGVAALFECPSRPGLRLDPAVVAGSHIGIHYDPLLAKVIAWAPDRDEAARRLAGALARARLHGLVTNRELLVRTLRHPAFRAGQTTTAFLERHRSGLVDPPGCAETRRLPALAAALAGAAANRARAAVLASLPSGWRNLPSGPQRAAYRIGDERVEVAYRHTRDGLVADGYDTVALIGATPGRVVLEVGRVRHTFEVATYGDTVEVDSVLGAVTLRRLPRFTQPEPAVAPGSLVSPMPGTVVRVTVAVGDAVEAGTPLLVLEAMKMEHQLVAPEPGVVRALHAGPGQQVEPGAVLVTIDDAEVPEVSEVQP